MDKEDLASDSDLSDEDYCPEKEKAKLSAAQDSSASADSEDNCDSISLANSKPSKRVKKMTLKKSAKKSKKGKTGDNNDSNSDESDEERVGTKTHKVIEDSSRKITRGSLASENKSETKTIEKNILDSDEEEKKRTESLWASFMSEATPSSSNTDPKKPPLPEVAKSTDDKPEKVTEIIEFAGEKLKVEKSSMEKIRQITSRFARGPPKRTASIGGIGAVLGKIGKKTKLSVLEKTKLDWNSFKQDEGISEELETFNKGKDGYLERQDFLQRTDLRQFEIERSLRQAQRNKQ